MTVDLLWIPLRHLLAAVARVALWIAGRWSR